MENGHSELMAWLAELEAEQAQRAVVIATLRQKLGLPAEDGLGVTVALPTISAGATVAPMTPMTPATGGLRSDTFFRLSIPEAIKKYLGMVKRPQSPKDIAYSLKQGGVLSQSADFNSTVHTALSRLSVAGDLVKTKEGWGLSEWYPSGKRPEPTIKKKKSPKRPRPTKAAGGLSHRPATEQTRLLPPGETSVDDSVEATTWRPFLQKALREGKSMQEAAAAFKEMRAVEEIGK
jgi:hypothetical protein